MTIRITDFAALAADIDFAESLGVSEEDLEELPLGAFNADGVEDIEQVGAWMPSSNYLWVISGSFEFEDIRDDLDDEGFEETSYRGYEVWEGPIFYALLEEAGYVIYSESEDDLEDSLGVLYRGEGAIADAEDNDLKRVLDKLGKATFITAFGECENVRRCQSYGIAYHTEYDIEAAGTKVDFLALFSSERAAEDAADDYDEVADAVEQGGSFGSRFLDIGDIKTDGEFVVGQGILESP